MSIGTLSRVFRFGLGGMSSQADDDASLRTVWCFRVCDKGENDIVSGTFNKSQSSVYTKRGYEWRRLDKEYVISFMKTLRVT